MPEPVVLSWSGGKDSAMALRELQLDDRYEVVALLTTVADEFKRISHHGVREELLELQARALDIPLDRIYLPSDSGLPTRNESWEEQMGFALAKYRSSGITKVAHGDLFLADLREYRERNLARVGMQGLFPLWQRNTTQLIHSFIQLGFRAYLSCVEARLGESFAGRAIDASLVRELPADVDPCGEYGEFHSFVYDGPPFSCPLSIEVGETVLRDTRYFAELRPAGHSVGHSEMPPLRRFEGCDGSPIG